MGPNIFPFWRPSSSYQIKTSCNKEDHVVCLNESDGLIFLDHGYAELDIIRTEAILYSLDRLDGCWFLAAVFTGSIRLFSCTVVADATSMIICNYRNKKNETTSKTIFSTPAGALYLVKTIRKHSPKLMFDWIRND